ncbi:UPF0223 family protein [Streptococcus sp. sy018]|uniref:UPF0223 family protein n=1 Tax=Streptococcus sp. sy018 TaxID=2600147 RepID=UPI0011B360DE|nr:UPF0223 family protein [Streptococcus sp. sy018]TWS95645.1 UPF0223 family protein [Streptococcus sp. sy018]
MKNYSYPIDVSWSTSELTAVLHFLGLVEQAYEGNVTVENLLEAYQAFKQVVPSKAQEKQLDREFEKNSGYSTYRAVQEAKNLEKGRLSLGK